MKTVTTKLHKVVNSLPGNFINYQNSFEGQVLPFLNKKICKYLFLECLYSLQLDHGKSKRTQGKHLLLLH